MNSALTSKFRGTRVIVSRSVSANYTFDDQTEAVNVNASGGPITITLPLISANIGRLVTIRKIDASANVVTIQTSGADSYEGSSSTTLEDQWALLSLDNNGSQWLTAATNIDSGGGGGSAAGGTGAVQFAVGTSFAADATNLFWDNTNDRLGIGTNTPSDPLDVAGIIRTQTGIRFADDSVQEVAAQPAYSWKTNALTAETDGRNFFASYSLIKLPDDSFFVVGGAAGSQASAEVINSTATASVATGAPTQNRSDGTRAVLLNNGTVLVVGGAASPLTSETWNPGTGLFTARGACSHVQGGGIAAQNNGNAVVFGGSNLSPLDTTQIYNAGSGTWSASGNMIVGRGSFGKSVRVTGGTIGRVFVAGGIVAGGDQTNTTELYDGDTGTWTAKATMATARSDSANVLMADGKVMVAGGFNTSGSVILSTVEIWDPVANTWATTGNLNFPRAGGHAVLLSDGRIVLGGGFPTIGTDRNVLTEIYSPVTGKWTILTEGLNYTPASPSDPGHAVYGADLQVLTGVTGIGAVIAVGGMGSFWPAGVNIRDIRQLKLDTFPSKLLTFTLKQALDSQGATPFIFSTNLNSSLGPGKTLNFQSPEPTFDPLLLISADSSANPTYGSGVSIGGDTFISTAVDNIFSNHVDLKAELLLDTQAGTAGQVLTSAGTGAVPVWETPDKDFAISHYHNNLSNPFNTGDVNNKWHTPSSEFADSDWTLANIATNGLQASNVNTGADTASVQFRFKLASWSRLKLSYIFEGSGNTLLLRIRKVETIGNPSVTEMSYEPFDIMLPFTTSGPTVPEEFFTLPIPPGTYTVIFQYTSADVSGEEAYIEDFSVIPLESQEWNTFLEDFMTVGGVNSWNASRLVGSNTGDATVFETQDGTGSPDSLGLLSMFAEDSVATSFCQLAGGAGFFLPDTQGPSVDFGLTLDAATAADTEIKLGFGSLNADPSSSGYVILHSTSGGNWFLESDNGQSSIDTGVAPDTSNFQHIKIEMIKDNVARAFINGRKVAEWTGVTCTVSGIPFIRVDGITAGSPAKVTLDYMHVSWLRRFGGGLV